MTSPSQPSPDDPGSSGQEGRSDTREHGPRGRPRAAWTAVTVGVLLAVLLVVFIAQNTQKVTISFLGWDGRVPLAVGLLIAAVLGAALVLVIGTIRVTQLKLAERRQRRLNRDRG